MKLNIFFEYNDQHVNWLTSIDGSAGDIFTQPEGIILDEDREGSPETFVEELKGLEASEHSVNLVGIVPADAIYLNYILLPAKQRSRLQQALPYILEDELLGEPEDYHFAIKPGRGDYVLVAAVKRAYMADLLGNMAEDGIYPDELIPESCFNPEKSDGQEEWVLWDNGESSLLQLGSGNVIKFLPDQLSHILKIAASQLDETIRSLDIQYFTPTENSVALGLLESELSDPEGGLELHVKPEIVPDTRLAMIAGHYQGKLSFNLLQGAFKPSKKSRIPSGIHWRVPAVVGTVFLTAIFLLVIGKIAWYAVMTGKLEDEVKQAYAKQYPQDRNFARMKTNLSRLGRTSGIQEASSDTGFLQLMAMAGDAIQKLEASGNGVRIERINYGDRSTGLKLQMAGKDVTAFEQFKKAVEQYGVTAEISSAVAKDDGYQAQIIVKG